MTIKDDGRHGRAMDAAEILQRRLKEPCRCAQKCCVTCTRYAIACSLLGFVVAERKARKRA